MTTNKATAAIITAGSTLTARSICDHNCIFSLDVLDRKGGFALVRIMGNEKRVKVRTDSEGNEYLRPENYSMAPSFRAPKNI